MQHFQATFFEMQRQLEKGDFGVEGAQGTTIKCRKEEIQNDEAKELWLDFTPCVDVPFWPDSGIEWYLRPRKRFQHKPTGTVYQWPPKGDYDRLNLFIYLEDFPIHMDCD